MYLLWVFCEKKGVYKYSKRNFNITPSGKNIEYDGDLLVVRKRRISDVQDDVRNDVQDIKNDNPPKRQKTFEEEFNEFVKTVENHPTQNQELDEIISLLPAVILNLKEANQLQIIKDFFRLVSQDQFPLKNLAYQLFLDVVRWFAADSDKEMRYSPEVMTFWKIGKILFHGKFIRLMTGIEQEEPNFVVPTDTLLRFRNEKEPPGILKNLKLVAENASEMDTFRISIDGKKVNSNRTDVLSEIYLFGFKSSPTVAERKSRLENEFSLVNKLEDLHFLAKETPCTFKVKGNNF